MLRKIAAFTMAIPLLAACDTYSAAANSLTPQESSLVDSTCREVMGLRKGEYYYDMCQESLGRSLAARAQGEARLQSYSQCRHQGYAEGSGALAACVLENSDAAQPRVASAETPVQLSYPRDELKAGESYYNVTPRTHWKREQYSCAQLGFVPGASAFTQCVANLDADLLPGLD